MRSTLAARIRRLPQWALPEVGPARGPVTDTSAEARGQEMEWLAFALSAAPEARSELRDLLTEAEERVLAAQFEAMTAVQIRWLRETIDLGDEAQVEALHGRLSSLFDGAEAAPSPSLPALEDYVAQPGRVRMVIKNYKTEGGETKRQFRTALFESGRYDPSCDETLRRLGFTAVAIQSPQAPELARFGEDDGFTFRSDRLHWATATTSLESYIQALPSTSLRTGFRHKLKQSAECLADFGPMTEARYEAWREVFAREVGSRPGGLETYIKGHVAALAQSGELDLWRTALFHSPTNPDQVIGGSLLQHNVRYGGFWVISGAAYDSAFRKLHLPIRTMATVLELATSSALPVVSHGVDPNFYGFMLSVGLMGFKASLGLTPYPHGQFELFKFLTFAPFEAERSIVFLSVKRGSELERRYLEALATPEIPVARRLMNGRIGSPEALAAADSLQVQHYTSGDGGTGATNPHGLTIVEHRMSVGSTAA